MSLLDRLRGTEDPQIPGHPFQAAMSEWADGAAGFSRATIISNFDIQPADEAELDALKSIWDGANTNAKQRRMRNAFDSILMLIEDDYTFYDTKAKINARLQAVVA